ncbi:MAG: Asp-tRNA(Asn)/Glu-tRNA(Gln) amidotransferase subunit GatB [Anaerolineae bacterium]|nr:Asp-tRNA(Asn)/Glu-tRNA(Gln) amidotransferase subunit GatB [Anaerolineae bacterium]
MEYEAVIGLEVHAQLLTRSKMFCRCQVVDSTEAEPNLYTCPVCTGMPGSLPVINRKAVEYTIMTGLALHCQIAQHTFWERKSYFYPDLPKGYQISQYQLPLAYDGWLEVEVEGQRRRIGITRAHLEEDTGKLFHRGDHSLVDFNRAGVPLLEIVSEPDIRTPEEARQYLMRLRTILRYLGVSTGDMEKGAMRCEANVSVRPRGSRELGTKVEVKNLNSFRSVKLALEHEIARQIAVLERGERVEQVTMGWDEDRGRTVVQRTKEMAEDYRYFPEPDLPPLAVDEAWVEALRSQLPELPEAKQGRFVQQYGLPEDVAAVLVEDRAVADYFEACVAAHPDPRTVANWIVGEVFRMLRRHNQEMVQMPVPPAHLAELLALVERGTLTLNLAKAVFEEMYETGRPPGQIVEAKGLAVMGDASELEPIVEQVIQEHPDAVAQYLRGKEGVLGFLIGQVMRATRGKADPKLVGRMLAERLKEGP